jgi:hypothetical protein
MCVCGILNEILTKIIFQSDINVDNRVISER